MTTEPVIIPPANFSDADVVDWMKEKLSSIKVLGELNARRQELVDKLEKLDAEIDKYKIKSAIQIQSK
ncbi:MULTISPECIES: hypothetical protein [Enterobacterales]|uniref:hypothetical protein n=1 Tax=Enterobacterales TaxID=91347 RepID=UPI0007CC3BEB|nr:MULTISPECIES: hypothetical protein [Enterobacterales]MCI9727723.1 hypothetical protein [Proteus mirabilis]MCI9731480.1 hypothetical protein [Proteus mirabilis]MCI9735235.1 hypothetical protein [Proteus mirabilis]MCI9756026.1 hypothetical protein [Proteus mirabilis]MCI9759784.1 hypothetical protein [Proteus mirabilis]